MASMSVLSKPPDLEGGQSKGTERIDLSGKYTPSRQFRFDHLIRWGGQGSVYRGTDVSTGGFVAIKAVPMTDSQRATRRLSEEEKWLGIAVGHPHHMQLIKVEKCDDFQMVYFVTTLYDGDCRSFKRTDEFTCLRYAMDILDAVNYMWSKRFVHRDLKPENILHVLRGGVVRLILADFGSCAYMPEGVVRSTICGTYGYTRPDRFDVSDLDNGDPAAFADLQREDIFQLGCTFAYFLRGFSPLASELEDQRLTWSSRHKVSNRAKAFVRLCLFGPQDLQPDAVLGHEWLKKGPGDIDERTVSPSMHLKLNAMTNGTPGQDEHKTSTPMQDDARAKRRQPPAATPEGSRVGKKAPLRSLSPSKRARVDASESGSDIGGRSNLPNETMSDASYAPFAPPLHQQSPPGARSTSSTSGAGYVASSAVAHNEQCHPPSSAFYVPQRDASFWDLPDSPSYVAPTYPPARVQIYKDDAQTASNTLRAAKADRERAMTSPYTTFQQLEELRKAEREAEAAFGAAQALADGAEAHMTLLRPKRNSFGDVVYEELGEFQVGGLYGPVEGDDMEDIDRVQFSLTVDHIYRRELQHASASGLSEQPSFPASGPQYPPSQYPSTASQPQDGSQQPSFTPNLSLGNAAHVGDESTTPLSNAFTSSSKPSQHGPSNAQGTGMSALVAGAAGGSLGRQQAQGLLPLPGVGQTSVPTLHNLIACGECDKMHPVNASLLEKRHIHKLKTFGHEKCAAFLTSEGCHKSFCMVIHDINPRSPPGQSEICWVFLTALRHAYAESPSFIRTSAHVCEAFMSSGAGCSLNMCSGLHIENYNDLAEEDRRCLCLSFVQGQCSDDPSVCHRGYAHNSNPYAGLAPLAL